MTNAKCHKKPFIHTDAEDVEVTNPCPLCIIGETVTIRGETYTLDRLEELSLRLLRRLVARVGLTGLLEMDEDEDIKRFMHTVLLQEGVYAAHDPSYGPRIVQMERDGIL